MTGTLGGAADALSRGMHRTLCFLAVLVLPPLASWGASPVTAAFDGNCVQGPQDALDQLQADLSAMGLNGKDKAAPPCVPVNDARRAILEKAELDRMAKAANDSIDNTCSLRTCVSNFSTLSWCQAKFWGPKCFGGCAAFAEVTHIAATQQLYKGDTTGDGSQRYWTVFQEQRCQAAPGLAVGLPNGKTQHLLDWCHWVTVAHNPRTGEYVALDGWKQAGGAVMANSDRGATGVLHSYKEYRERYPLPSEKPEDDVKTGSCNRANEASGRKALEDKSWEP